MIETRKIMKKRSMLGIDKEYVKFFKDSKSNGITNHLSTRLPFYNLKNKPYNQIDSDLNISLYQKSFLQAKNHKTPDSNFSSKENATLHKIFKFLKMNSQRRDKEKLKLKNVEELIIEWKEVARKLENILFVLTMLTITITPIILFGNLFLRDVTLTNPSSLKCGCENSFVKNI